MKKFIIGLVIGLIFTASVGYCYRMAKPRRITDFNDNNLVVLNDTLEELWNITNSRYEHYHGDMYVEDVDVAIEITLQDTYYRVDAWSTGSEGVNGASDGTTPDVANDQIIIVTGGEYLTQWTVSCYSAAKSEYEFEIFTNGGTTAYPETESYRTTSVADAVGLVSGVGICRFYTGDKVELWVKRKDGGSPPAKTITIRAATITIVKLGD